MAFSEVPGASTGEPLTSGGPAPVEHVIVRLRPHARILVAPCVALIATAGAVGYFAGTFPEPWQNNALIAGAGLVLLLLWLVPLVAWLSQRYVITTRRIIITRGLVVRRRVELLHSRSHDITLRRTVLQSLFRSGNLLINSGLDTPVVLRDVPVANRVQSVLHDLIEEHNANVSKMQSFRPVLSGDSVAWGPS